MKKLTYIAAVLVLFSFWGCNSNPEDSNVPAEHPCLLISSDGLEDIRSEIIKPGIMQFSVVKAKAEVAEYLNGGMDVPVPRDPGGGYTHEKHKQNYKFMLNAALLYHIYDDEEYAAPVKQMLLEYSAMYNDLPDHPAKKNQAPGKLFWQSLNECVWLVYTAQAYDLMYDFLSVEERTAIEETLLKPVSDFLIASYSFDRIHNHGLWAAAGVGMAAMAMDDSLRLQQALYGSVPEKNTGFLAKLDWLYSPDGYYTEGPYYHRYSLMPVVVFAEALHKNYPEKNIFAYRDSIIPKAIEKILYLTDDHGNFFIVNDGLKHKSFKTEELVYGVNILFAECGQDAGLPTVAEMQETVSITDAGVAIAKALRSQPAKPFRKPSMILRDGPNGEQGALILHRYPETTPQTTLLFEASSQGMGHGHFDRLSFMYYDNGFEILPDYGSARYLNIEQKHGGRYLDENKSFAKQTIAHNTLIVDRTSQYGGDVATASEEAPQVLFYDDIDPEHQISSAIVENPYPGVSMWRTMMLVNEDFLDFPIIIDVMKAFADDEHEYDLVFHYKGDPIEYLFPYMANTTSLKPFGSDYGYQHMWNMASGVVKEGLAGITLQQKNRFYSVVSEISQPTTCYLLQSGANDPEYNIVHDRALLYRTSGDEGFSMTSIIAPHGSFDAVAERTVNSHHNIKNITTIYSNDCHSAVVLIEFKNSDRKIELMISDHSGNHAVMHNGVSYEWDGFWKYNLK